MVLSLESSSERLRPVVGGAASSGATKSLALRKRRGLRGRDSLSFHANLADVGGAIVPFRSTFYCQPAWLVSAPGPAREVFVTHAAKLARNLHPYALLRDLLTPHGRRLLGLCDERRPRGLDESLAYAARVFLGWLEGATARWAELPGATYELGLDLDRANIHTLTETMTGAVLGPDDIDAFIAATNGFEECIISLSESNTTQVRDRPDLAEPYADAVETQRELARRVLTQLGSANRGRELAADPDLQEAVIRVLVNGAVGTALAWNLYAIAGEQDLQERLYEDVMSVVPRDRGPAPRDLEQLARLRASCNEALRLYPPALLVHRQALEPLEIGGVELAKDDMLVVNLYALHRNRGAWDRPEVFDHGRFMPGASRVPFSHLPFGAGPGSCAAGSYATALVGVGMAFLLRRFRFRRSADQPVTPVGMIGLQPSPGLFLDVSRR